VNIVGWSVGLVIEIMVGRGGVGTGCLNFTWLIVLACFIFI